MDLRPPMDMAGMVEYYTPPTKDICINCFQLPGLGLPILATAGSRSADAIGSVGLGLVVLGFSGMCVCWPLGDMYDGLSVLAGPGPGVRGLPSSMRWFLLGLVLPSPAWSFFRSFRFPEPLRGWTRQIITGPGLPRPRQTLRVYGRPYMVGL